MKLRPERLHEQLLGQRSTAPLAPVYLVSGDDPLLVNEVVDVLRAAAGRRGLAERIAHVVGGHFNWDAVGASLSNLSLFSSGTLVEVRLTKATPGDEGSRELRRLATRAPDGNCVLVITPKLTGKTAQSAWVSALAEAGVWVETRQPDLAELPDWIARRFRAAGLGCEAEGLQLLAERVEGNLLAAQQEIDKLALLHAPATVLTANQIREAVADGARFDVFQLADAALLGDVPRAVRVLNGLREEGTAAPLVLWSLVREALLLADAGARASVERDPGRGVRSAGVWQSRAGLYVRSLRNHQKQPGSLRRLVRMAGRADQIVKGSRRGDPWNALTELTLALAGQPFRGAELV
jgi:DNA polymerase-3 subunit delta